jgi:hypothetical protein
MTDTKTIIIAQIFISCMMAFMMTGIFSFLSLGPTVHWLQAWSRGFVTAWPIAFVLSLIVGKLAFKLAGMITGKAA